MRKPKIDRKPVALRVPSDLLALVDAEAARLSESRHGVILALIEHGLLTRQRGPILLGTQTAPEPPLETSYIATGSRTDGTHRNRLLTPAEFEADWKRNHQAMQIGPIPTKPGARLKKDKAK